jgi:putative transposase
MRQSYPSDLTDEPWAIIEPLIPVHKVGRPRVHDVREILNALFSINRAGCQWDMLPHDFPHKNTVHNHYTQWRSDGTWPEIMDALRRAVRLSLNKEPSPSAASIDSQTVKGTEVGGVRGYDGGKKINGVKRHIIVDTLGLLLVVVVSAASADDGTFAPEVLGKLTAEQRTRLTKIWADGKYRNHHLEGWLVKSKAGYCLEVVSRPPGSKGFVKLPRRWVVERTFAWLGRYRRNSRHYEWLPESREAMIQISSIHRMLRPLKPDKTKGSAPFKYRKNQEKVPG